MSGLTEELTLASQVEEMVPDRKGLIRETIGDFTPTGENLPMRRKMTREIAVENYDALQKERVSCIYFPRRTRPEDSRREFLRVAPHTILEHGPGMGRASSFTPLIR